MGDTTNTPPLILPPFWGSLLPHILRNENPPFNNPILFLPLYAWTNIILHTYIGLLIKIRLYSFLFETADYIEICFVDNNSYWNIPVQFYNFHTSMFYPFIPFKTKDK